MVPTNSQALPGDWPSYSISREVVDTHTCGVVIPSSCRTDRLGHWRESIPDMDWGKMDERPFDAAVWGTAAEWVGAIGTTLAALIAAGVYFWDRRTNARVQAQQIIFRHEVAGGQVSVRNVSTLPVFKVRLIWKIRRYRRRNGNPSRRELRRSLAEIDVAWDVIEPGQTEEALHLHSQPIEADVLFKPHLVVQDVRGKFWEIPALGERRGKPKRLRKYRVLAPLIIKTAPLNTLLFAGFIWHKARITAGWLRDCPHRMRRVREKLARKAGRDRPKEQGLETLNPSEKPE